MIRGIDHIVHVVRDLGGAAEIYEHLGFQVGAENAHPWGTRNRLVQLPCFYVELLSISEPEKILPHTERLYSFGAFNREFLQQCGEGLAQLVLQSADPSADKAAFDKAGFGGFDLIDFVRMGKRADGSAVEVAFSLAFARDPASPHAGFFTCLHKTPENIWSAELQRHKNGANGISGAVFAAENPTDHHIFLESFTGARDVHATSLGIRIETPQGDILVYDPRAFKDAFGVAPPHDAGIRFAAMIFKVHDCAATRALLEKAGFKLRELHNRVILGPEGAGGTVIGFENA